MSKTFCPLPWNHLATHPNGSVTLCCESDMENRNSESYNLEGDKRKFQTLHDTDYDFDKIVNSDYFNKVRLEMLDGKIPSSCAKCFNYEKNNLESKRQRELKRLDFNFDIAKKVTNNNGSLKEVNYEFIELRLGNHCNLACRTCNPVSSTRWKEDWFQLHQYYIPFQSRFDWPLKEKFWTNLAKVSSKVKKIYINGGEPLLIDKHLQYLEFLVKNDYAKDIDLNYSTNSTVKNDIYLDVWSKFKSIEFMLSIDDIEHRNEYLRYPSTWKKTMQTLDWFERIKEQLSNVTLCLMQTISLMNIYYIKEYTNYFRPRSLHIHRNYVYAPNYYSAINLPQNVKKIILEKNANVNDYVSLENFLKVEGNTKYLQQFFEINNKLDGIRQESFKNVFDEWYEIIRKNVNET